MASLLLPYDSQRTPENPSTPAPVSRTHRQPRQPTVHPVVTRTTPPCLSSPHLSVLQRRLHGPDALVDVDAAVQGVNFQPPARALQRLALQLEGVVGGQEDHDGVARVGVALVQVQDELAHQVLDARVHLGVRVLEPGADADAQLGGDLDTKIMSVW